MGEIYIKFIPHGGCNKHVGLFSTLMYHEQHKIDYMNTLTIAQIKLNVLP